MDTGETLAREVAQLQGWIGLRMDDLRGNCYVGVAPGDRYVQPMSRPDRDYGDALRLMEYTLSQTVDDKRITVRVIARTTAGQWRVELGAYYAIDYIGTADALPMAMTLACRDALQAALDVSDGETPK